VWWNRPIARQERRMKRKIGCRFGRHYWEYLIGADLVVRWCPTCQDPKIADVFPAKRIGTAPPVVDRPFPAYTGELRSAAGLLKAMSVADVEAINVLGKYVDDPLKLLLSLCWLIGDALGHPPSDDLPAYAERVFERLEEAR
jgi:hypothetical protein